MSRDGQVAVTRKTKMRADTERANGITDLVEAGSIVAIAAADDACYDCYLLKVFSPSELRLSSNTVDDYGVAYQKGPFFLKATFSLEITLLIRLTS